MPLLVKTSMSTLTHFLLIFQTRRETFWATMDDYAKDGGTEGVLFLCCFCPDPLHAQIIRNVNNFAI